MMNLLTKYQPKALLKTGIRHSRRLAICALLAVSVVSLFPQAGTTEDASPVFPLLHSGLDEAQLPPAGLPLSLQVVLPKESFSYNLVMQAQVYRDGELWDLFNLAPDHDEQDRLIYTVTLPSPRKELRYSFIFSNRQGFIQRSADYSVKRICEQGTGITPDTRPVIPDKQVPSREVLASLLEQSSGLEKDIQIYERAIEIATELKSSLEKK